MTTTREDSLKHQGSARRFCPECGVNPGTPRLASDQPRPRGVAPADPKASECDFADWPDLTARHTAAEAAELADRLKRGMQAAYDAVADAFTRAGPAAEWDARWETATEVDLAWQRAARETVQFHGREPGQPVDEWITTIRQETPRRQAGQEEEMFRRFGRKAREARRGWAEADRLYAIADELERQAGEPPDYRREITAERAARVMRQLGEPLTRDTQAQASGAELAGTELDAEIDRLAEAFPEPGSPPDCGRRAPDHLQAQEHFRDQLDRNAAVAEQARQRELGAATVARLAQQASAGPASPEGASALQQAQRPGREAREQRQAATAAAYEDATSLQQSGIGLDPDWDAPDHLYGSPECTEPDPESDHFGWSQADPEDAGRFPLPRVLDASQASPVLAPEAATLPDGTPHADPFLAERGWQADGGVYTRQAEPQMEAG